MAREAEPQNTPVVAAFTKTVAKVLAWHRQNGVGFNIGDYSHNSGVVVYIAIAVKRLWFA